MVALQSSTTTATEDLLRAARAGNRDAIERLFLPHEPALRGVCRGMLVQIEDAEDALQETFLRALRSLDSFRGDSSLKTWLVRIAICVCAERRRSHRGEDSLNHLSAHAISPSPEDEVERRTLLYESLATLSPQRRVVLLLKADGWTLDEIGRAHGWSVSRVKVELFRARTALEKWAAKKAQEETS